MGETTVYIAIVDDDHQLNIDGNMELFDRLLKVLRPGVDQPTAAQPDDQEREPVTS